MNVLIPRNTPIPVTKEATYYTVQDNQTSIDVPVFEGERKMAVDNREVDEFTLFGFEQMPAGEAKMMVRFELDENSILTVTAFDVKNKDNMKSV